MKDIFVGTHFCNAFIGKTGRHNFSPLRANSCFRGRGKSAFFVEWRIIYKLIRGAIRLLARYSWTRPFSKKHIKKRRRFLCSIKKKTIPMIPSNVIIYTLQWHFREVSNIKLNTYVILISWAGKKKAADLLCWIFIFIFHLLLLLLYARHGRVVEAFSFCNTSHSRFNP